LFFVGRVAGPDPHLDELRRLIPDQEVVVLLHVLDDRLIHLVPAHANGGFADDPRESDDRDFRRPAPDVDHHVPGGFVDRETHADGCGDGLGHQEDFPRTRMFRRITDGTLLHFRNSRRYADDDSRPDEPGQETVLLNSFDELAQHDFGDFEIRNHAVFERSNGDDLSRRAAQHGFGVFAHRHHLAGGLLDGHDGGFVQNDAAALDVHERVGRTEVNRNIVGDPTR